MVLESTVPPGATESIAVILKEETGLSPEELHVAHAPERVLPGQIVREVVQQRRYYRRSGRRLHRGVRRLLPNVRFRKAPRYLLTHGGDREASGECLPRREYRLRQ